MNKRKQKASEEESAHNRRQQAEQRIYDRRQAELKAVNEQANIIRQQDLDHQVRMAQVDAGKLGDNVTKVILTSVSNVPEGYSTVLVDQYGRPLKLSGMDEILSISFSDIDKDYFSK